MRANHLVCLGLLAAMALPCAAQTATAPEAAPTAPAPLAAVTGEVESAEVSQAKTTTQMLDLSIHRLGRHPTLLVSTFVSAKEGPEPAAFSITRTSTYVAARVAWASVDLLVPGTFTEGVEGVVENKVDQPDVLRISIETLSKNKIPSIVNGVSVAQTKRTQIALILQPGNHTKNFDIDGVPHQLVMNYQLAPNK